MTPGPSSAVGGRSTVVTRRMARGPSIGLLVAVAIICLAAGVILAVLVMKRTGH
jgi:hypothetical protein